MYKFCSYRDKKPFGAVKEGENVTITFPVTHEVWVHSVKMFLRKGDSITCYPVPFSYDDGEVTYFRTTFSVAERGIYHYRFEVELEGGGKHYVGLEDMGRATFGEGLPEWQLTVYAANYVQPRAPHGGVIYHVFVDRFCHEGENIQPRYGVLKNWGDELTTVDSDGVYRANDFYGGNIKGIISKLDYFVSLGVTCLYLSPIFESASNHRYDTGDYMKIDEMIGTEAEFEELIEKGKAKGVGIILDGVFNHTGADSIYFNKFGHYDSHGAANGMDSPYFDWYDFTSYPDEYRCWWGCTVVPTVNKQAEGYRNLIFGKDGVLDKWTKKGIAGWRLDVADELPTEFLSEVNKAVKRANPEAAVIGEVWEDASTKVSYGTWRPYLTDMQLDGVMNYPFKEAILSFCKCGTAENFARDVMTIAENYPSEALANCMTLLGSHDTIRVLNALSDVNVWNKSKEERKHIKIEGDALDLAIGRLKLASLLQFMLPGVPTIYYGDEIGMQGYEDPLNRACYPWGDGDANLLEHYRKLGALRNRHKDALCGGVQFNIAEDGRFLMLRKGTAEILYVAACASSEWKGIAVPNGADVVLLSDGSHIIDGTLWLPPLGYAILTAKK